MAIVPLSVRHDKLRIDIAAILHPFPTRLFIAFIRQQVGSTAELGPERESGRKPATRANGVDTPVILATVNQSVGGVVAG